MDRKQSLKIIKNTFENKFEKEVFIKFIIELLNLKSEVISDSGIAFNLTTIPNTYKPYIDSFEKVTSYHQNGNILDILIIRLQKHTSIERARTMQRNFIAWYLKGGCDGDTKDAALAAFVSPDEKDWRFSLIRMDYSVTEDKKGAARLIEQFSPAKRWSFLVGSNEKSHTAQAQLIEIISRDDQDIRISELEEAFSVERVTKEFFTKYRELFFKTKDALDEIVDKDIKVKSDFESKNISTVDFAKKLLGQIVFLYFLQKKGWFGVVRDTDWGTGSKNFIRELFNGKHCNYNNFFNDILEPLFYEALRYDRSHDDGYYSKFNCKIPFLNGGLFDPIGDYDWSKTDVKIPNDLFSNTESMNEGDIGTGILDIFDRYNFTVQEDEPLEKEVAVDPEMLGKVFENLLEVKDRKSKGTYYTPREIVHYMCQQSLINYLFTELEDIVKKEDIDVLIKYSGHVGEDVDSAEKFKLDIPSDLLEKGSLIDEKLANIKVCDPAVGSGAFLVGMMSEIIRTRNVLSGYMEKQYRSIYALKRDCIEKSLYGVDIDPGAVEICKLRLWLSLIVDEDDVKNIKPLPNLDYKIVCGNSLLGVEINLFNQETFNKLEKLKPVYFSETNVNKKHEYKRQIEQLIADVTNGNEEFDFEIYFSEVFHKKIGFDIVIANPPYINVKRGISEFDKNYFKKADKSATGQFDLFSLFIEKGLTITCNILSFIVPKPFINNENYERIRRICLEAGIFKIVTGSYIFEEAGVESCVFFIAKLQKHHQIETLSFSNSCFKSNNIIDKEFVYKLPFNIISTEIYPKDIMVLKKMWRESKPFGSIISLTRGVEIGKNDKNIIKKQTPYKLITGEDLSKYKLNYRGLYIIFNKNDVSSFKPLELYINNKILIRRVGSNIVATYDSNGYIVLNTIYCGIPQKPGIDLKYLTALLNSRLISFWFKKIFVLNDKLFPYIRKSQLDFIPIKNTHDTEKLEIVNIVDKVLNIIKDNDYIINLQKQEMVKTFVKQIDQIVYEVYGLIPEEIEIVENFK